MTRKSNKMVPLKNEEEDEKDKEEEEDGGTKGGDKKNSQDHYRPGQTLTTRQPTDEHTSQHQLPQQRYTNCHTGPLTREVPFTVLFQ